MMTKQDWEFQIGHIEGWLAEHGYQLVQATDEEDQVELAAGVVRINSRQHPETRFYTLLHEAGHVDIYENGAAEFADEHPMYVQAEHGRSATSKAFRVSLLAEELEAWRIGRRLAATRLRPVMLRLNSRLGFGRRLRPGDWWSGATRRRT